MSSNATGNQSGLVSPQVAVPVATAEGNSGAQNARVLHLINGEHFSGAERVQDLLAMCLPNYGYDVGFACVKPGKFADARQSTCELHDFTMGSKLDVRAVRHLANIVKDSDYKIVHAHTPRTAMIARMVSEIASVPMVYHVHSPTSQDSTRRMANRINTLVERLSVAHAPHLITVSHSLADHMAEAGIHRDRISVVPNGVPCADEIPQRGLPQGVWTMGTIALFRPRKGTEVLLEALAILRLQGRRVQVRAVGGFETPEYEKELKGFAERLGIDHAVEWTGFTRDVNGQLAEMDMFVLPSLFGEGLPMVVLEAMAYGVPCIGTDVEGVPEAIRDGIDGLIAKSGSADNLARTIDRVLTGQLDWSILRDTAIKRQAERFSDHSMSRGVADAYNQVLQRTVRS